MDWKKLNKAVIQSRKINAVSFGAESLYYRIVLLADDLGHFFARPEMVKGMCMPVRRITVTAIAKYLDELHAIGLIEVYTARGEMYLEILGYEKYQYFRKDIKKFVDYPRRKPGDTVPLTARQRGGNTIIRKNKTQTQNKNLGKDKKDKTEPKTLTPDSAQGTEPAGSDVELTQLLMDLILKNDPKSKVQRMPQSTQEKWLTECRRLREIDKRTPQEIAFVIEWTQQDSFEKTNVLSMPKLRKRFSQLLLKAKRAKGFDKFVRTTDW